MALNSLTVALNGVGPLLADDETVATMREKGMRMQGLLVNAFELRYALFRGNFLVYMSFPSS